MIISKNDICFDKSSYIDPHGKVFYCNNEIYRAISPDASSFITGLFEKGIVSHLVSCRLLIDTSIVEDTLPGYNLILKHRRIAWANYCVEWPFLLLKKAALHTLHLSMELLTNDLYLQDAYPWNIFFEGTSPVFIDFTSIVRPDSQILWPAYQQFCQFFLFPLYLYKCSGGKVVRSLLYDYINGITYHDFMSLSPLYFKITHPFCYAKRILPEILGELANHSVRINHRIVNVSKHRYIDSVRMMGDRQKFYNDLLNDVEALSLPVQKRKSRWTSYYDGEAKDLDNKLSVLSILLDRIKPESVFDIGCNTGEFSILAAKSGARVVAFDSDDQCVENLAQKAEKMKLDILPLVIDFNNPTPSFGWSACQFPAADRRLNCDMVFALALIHHLVFQQRQNFERILNGLLRYHFNWLVIEFIDITDSYIQQWSIPFERYNWYTRVAFESSLHSYFRRVETIGQVTETRMIYLCSERNG